MGSQKILRTAVIMRSWTLCLLLVATLASLLSTASAEFGGFKNSQNCPCECDCPGNGEKCECECECARQGSSCGPGFTQVCPSEDGSCPDNYMSLCPEDLTAAGRADTPLIEDRRRQRDIVTVKSEFKCQGKTVKCDFKTNFMPDCSSITSIAPKCTPKKDQVQWCNRRIFRWRQRQMHSDGDLQEQWKKTISNPNQYNPKSRLYNNNHNHNNNNTPRT